MTVDDDAHVLRVGLIADTHGLLRPEATAFLAGSDHIVHAGDVGDPAILDTLAAIAPRHRDQRATSTWMRGRPGFARQS